MWTVRVTSLSIGGGKKTWEKPVSSTHGCGIVKISATYWDTMCCVLKTKVSLPEKDKTLTASLKYMFLSY